ncbi:MAG TPA: rhodanese-like domain-containing protein [Rhodobacteraceae bacterium]|nr:rhodanese-like domain-containing protein [Paracoccaceae bacterium]
MSTGNVPGVGEVLPVAAWTRLKNDEDARLIDVRTQAEWSFVGIPDLSELGHALICLEWATFPGMSPNPRFADLVLEALGGHIPGTLMFLCRSGVRSKSAAAAVATKYAENGVVVDCLNVAEGFEGDLNEDGHRGFRNGWKFRGLAWRQS